MSMTINGTSGLTFNNASTSTVGAIGDGQTWTNYVANGTGSARVAGTTYTNSTGKPILALISGSLSGGTYTVNGVVVAYQNTNTIIPVSLIVPNGGTYSTTCTPYYWSELR